MYYFCFVFFLFLSLPIFPHITPGLAGFSSVFRRTCRISDVRLSIGQMLFHVWELNDRCLKYTSVITNQCCSRVRVLRVRVLVHMVRVQVRVLRVRVQVRVHMVRVQVRVRVLMV